MSAMMEARCFLLKQKSKNYIIIVVYSESDGNSLSYCPCYIQNAQRKFRRYIIIYPL
jgi:hypothetical protein